ncbi:MAG: anti-sigma factor [Thermorudis peleae]|nr:anti-sigma factor [Thermorudis peleae]
MDRDGVTHQDIWHDLPAYALGALADEEAQRVAAHLRVCPVCQAELARLDLAAATLGFALPPTPPPATLKDRVLTAALALPAEAPVGRVVATVHQQRWLARLRRVAWAAALVALLVESLVLGVLGVRLEHAERAQAQANARLAQVLAILRQADWSAPVLGESNGAAPIAGRVYVDSQGVAGVLIIDGLPPLPAQNLYQVWLIRPDGQRVNGGVFTVDRSRHAVVFLQAPDSWTAFIGMGITVEPSPGGSVKPTGPRVAGCTWNWGEG